MKTYIPIEIILLSVEKDDVLRTSLVSPVLWDAERNGNSWGEDVIPY